MVFKLNSYNISNSKSIKSSSNPLTFTSIGTILYSNSHFDSIDLSFNNNYNYRKEQSDSYESKDHHKKEHQQKQNDGNSSKGGDNISKNNGINDNDDEQMDDEDNNGEDNDGGDDDDENDDRQPVDLEDQQHFFDVFNTFRYYKIAFNRRIDQSLNFLNQMSPQHQEKLTKYRTHLEQVQLCVTHNYEVIKVIIADTAKMFKDAIYLKKKCSMVVKPERDLETDRIHSVLNQIAREWTNQGAAERNTSFNHILSAIDRHLDICSGKNNVQINRNKIRVLIPGAGLGRLAYEVAKRGYSCQGNEYSLMMLFVSNFILNKCTIPNTFTIYPWVSQFSNNLTSAHQLAPVTFPDVNPADIPSEVDFSMTAGSFTEIYSDDEACCWDCVITCFFLDTAPNVVDYIETIQRILKPNGVWINFGPLLYHYAEMPDPSIEPSYEIVRDIILSYGFVFLEEETNLNSFYTRNINSMLTFQYKSIYFVCRKGDEQTDSYNKNNNNII